VTREDVNNNNNNNNNNNTNNNNKDEIKELQKTALLAAAHKLREVLMKSKTNFTGEITLHVAQSVNTEELQYTLETWFVSGI
jgi:hypothetical protein